MRGTLRRVGQTQRMPEPVAPEETGPTAAVSSSDDRTHHLEIFLVSFAALLLEISYTRVVSFKLFYYYTYLVIGLSLLGIGVGGVAVAVSGRIRRASTDRILLVGLLGGALSVAAGYFVVAATPISTLDIWDYGTGRSATNLLALATICLALFASFIAVGVMIATILGRGGRAIGTLYFADLVGGGLACLVAVWLLDSIGAPGAVFLAGATLAAGGTWVALRSWPRLVPAGVVATLLLGVAVVVPTMLPTPRVDTFKQQPSNTEHSEWNAVFRVDAGLFADRMLLFHDGLSGSAIYEWDGDVASLERFDSDPRSLPFALDDDPPGRAMIIGAAGGHEVLVSLYYGVDEIEAVELNPVTHSLVADEFADYAGRLAEQPGVSWIQGDGRSHLARSDRQYDLIWYPAPDSYAATNAATAGAFVLSESYLYTSEAIVDSLDHLEPGGMLVAQFGEQNFERKPNRTGRYVSTVRHALAERGIDDPSDHVVLLTSPYLGPVFRNATIIVKETPFEPEEIARLESQMRQVEGTTIEYAPGVAPDPSPISEILTLPSDDLDSWYDRHEYDLSPITDDRPFFWHFTRFSDVVRDVSQPIDREDFEDTTGERVLLLLLVVAAVFAAVFLLVPFFAVREVWTTLPAKVRSGSYFAGLGLGFMLFEITMIQRLTLFLGYPTYSLTVTLASILVFTGVGAALSNRTARDPQRAVPVLAVSITALAAFYLFGLPPITNALLDSPLVLRVVLTFLVLAPLGICLGTFMPVGLRAVSRLTNHPTEYVAWSWAVNGFASVVGAVLTTVLAMAFGFQVVLVISLGVYLLALVVLRTLVREPIPPGVQVD
jgi:MFS family permease